MGDVDYNPLNPEQKNNPWPTFRAMREQCPVAHVEPFGLYAVSRYADVVAVAKDTTRCSSQTIQSGMFTFTPEAMALLEGCPTGWPTVQSLQTLDPPRHTGNRKVFNAAFSPRRLDATEPFIRSAAETLAEQLLTKRSVEFIADYGVPLPMQVIAHVFGFPANEITTLKRWSDLMAQAFSSGLSEGAQIESMQAVREWSLHLEEAVANRRANPQDDFLTVLATTERDDGTQFGMDEIVGLATESLIAGNETSTSLLAGMMYFLATQDGLLDRLRAEPDLRNNFVEEALRFISPVMGLFRVTKEAVEIADQKVPAGSHVQILWASANHDDSVFPDPEKLDLRRPNIRQHLSFGSGPHFCPGAPLSRFEARVTLELLVPRLRSIRLSDSFEPNWGPHFHLRGLTELPLELEVEA